jgi:hypothetical protein
MEERGRFTEVQPLWLSGRRLNRICCAQNSDLSNKTGTPFQRRNSLGRPCFLTLVLLFQVAVTLFYTNLRFVQTNVPHKQRIIR